MIMAWIEKVLTEPVKTDRIFYKSLDGDGDIVILLKTTSQPVISGSLLYNSITVGAEPLIVEIFLHESFIKTHLLIIRT